MPETLGAALAGRNGYELGRQAGGELYGGVYRGPIFILTHRPPTDETNPALDLSQRRHHRRRQDGIAAAKGKDLLVLGGTVAEQCLQSGLLDEIFVQVAPILLGDGIPFFRSSNLTADLDPISNTRKAAARTSATRYDADVDDERPGRLCGSRPGLCYFASWLLLRDDSEGEVGLAVAGDADG